MKTTSCVLVAAAVGTASAFMGPSPMMAGSSNKVSETRPYPPRKCNLGLNRLLVCALLRCLFYSPCKFSLLCGGDDVR